MGEAAGSKARSCSYPGVKCENVGCPGYHWENGIKYYHSWQAYYDI